MLNRLQFRLLIAFVLILMLTLGIIALALLVFLRSRPVPVDTLVNSLAAASLETDFRTAADELRQSRITDREELELIRTYLDETAQSTNYRLLVIQENNVLYDSQQIYAQGDVLNITEQRSLLGASPPLLQQRTPIFSTGVFKDSQGQVWVFVSRRLLPNAQGRRLATLVDYYVASPQPKQTLGRVIDDFGANFLIPLCQAGWIGLIFALLLSFWLARSVAKPLQAIAESSVKVAGGDYEQRVPVNGPTEAQIVAQAFNYMTAQVQETQQAQRDFLANVTHDLKTPLTSIQGFSQAIIDGVASQPEAARHAAEIINDEAARMNRLVSELLDIAKIQAGRMQMLRQAVSIAQILTAVSESMEVKARQKKIRLYVKIPALPRIAGDGDRLAQVFTNLVDNAIKHTDSGGQVWLMAEQNDYEILVQVQDSGEGIPPEDLPRIFERFYQVDKSRNRAAQNQGAGLGLAITAEIVRAHGGRIQVDSHIGVGSRFKVWLPAPSSDKSTIITLKGKTNF